MSLPEDVREKHLEKLRFADLLQDADYEIQTILKKYGLKRLEAYYLLSHIAHRVLHQIEEAAVQAELHGVAVRRD